MMKNLVLLIAGLLLFPWDAFSQNIEELEKLYAKKEYGQVITLGIEGLKDYPDNPRINMLVGRAYTDTRQFEKAIPYLKKGTISKDNLNWVQAWSYAYLGSCYYFTEDRKKSKESLNECLKLNATENSSKTAQGLLGLMQMSDFYNNWETIETEYIRFHFQESKNINNKELFIKNREAAYQEINKFFNAKPLKKIDFFVWDDPQQASNILKQELGFANSNFCMINSRNDQTRGHELTHILVSYGISPTSATRLINEGVAVYFDQTNRDRFSVAKESISGNDFDVIDLWENPKKYPNEYYYTIGGALISFLFEKGTDDQLKRLLKDQTVKSARSIYSDFDNLMKEFYEKLK